MINYNWCYDTLISLCFFAFIVTFYCISWGPVILNICIGLHSDRVMENKFLIMCGCSCKAKRLKDSLRSSLREPREPREPLEFAKTSMWYRQHPVASPGGSRVSNSSTEHRLAQVPDSDSVKHSPAIINILTIDSYISIFWWLLDSPGIDERRSRNGC